MEVGHDEGEGKMTWPFRYEASWGKREECQELITRAWDNTLHQLSKIQKATNGLRRGHLLMWSKTTFKKQKMLI